MKKKSRLKADPSVNPWMALLNILPLFTAIFLISILPTFVVIVLSFTDFEGSFEITKFVGFDNYKNIVIVIGPDILKAMWVTVKYSLFVVFPMQVMSLLSALAVNMKLFKMSNFFRALFFLPNILGVTVIAAIWNIMYSTAGGPVLELFSKFGYEGAMLGDPKIALLLISFMAIWAGFGFSMAIYLAGLQGIPKDYYEASVIDGAGAFKRFQYITLPLLVPSMTICVWVSLNTTLHVADYIFLTTRGGANTTTLGYYIFDRVVNNKLTQGQNAVVSLVFFVFVTLIMLSVNKVFRKMEVDL